jgi:hypothetical protein
LGQVGATPLLVFYTILRPLPESVKLIFTLRWLLCFVSLRRLIPSDSRSFLGTSAVPDSIMMMGACGLSRFISIATSCRQPNILDLSDMEEKSPDVLRMFETAAQNTPALVILEDLDRAFPTEGKRTQERRVSLQTGWDRRTG